ncbi:spore coat CotO family protein [Mesobacillus subterraneus]|uniref:CotO family spore coat protein n=1 Tax=Mesobacillus subterraneus TaxID=285983 RepID=UPI00203EC28E|nr:CotO family spore coat protein [Mesobacillus subterraneus]MCM3663071.1 spore coat CotO family protein [Mesobacillus subterraneus]MCM3682753.1 spore coat CotO family protein [Mesobacillus subterraneus]
MGRKRSRKQIPLFYIRQPNIEIPQPEMQENFVYKYSTKQNEMLNENNLTTDMVQKEADPQEISLEEEKVPEAEKMDTNKKKSFNEYSLEEKIKHLKLVPASVAKVKYEFLTIDRSYKGYFLNLKDGTLIIHSISPRKKSVSILVEDLVDIKRIGL